MRRNFLKLTVLFGVVIIGTIVFLRSSPVRQVKAVGDLNILWGVPDGQPIFVVQNLLPGDTENRTVKVVNSASSSRPIAVKGLVVEGSILANLLNITISENGTDRYGGISPSGPKTLADFFADSSTASGIPLSTLAPGSTTHYQFLVTIPTNAGNEYQGLSVIFNITFGINLPVSDECSGISFTGDPIYGTDGNDRINGTTGNDLIFALEGNDRVFGFGGDDCIIGGPGNDELRGETGSDTILGDAGDDLIVGAVGEDTLFGGLGNDTIRGENGNDQIDGGDNDDDITGGNGIDTIYAGNGNDSVSAESSADIVFGGAGNDRLDGGSDDDQIHGNTGNDTLLGKAGNDLLVGDEDTDTANGSSGIDTCIAETVTQCEL